MDLINWNLNKVVMPAHVDHAGVMWHGSYVSLLEEARLDALNSVGISYKEIVRTNYDLPVVSLEIKYLKSIYLGDQITLKTTFSQRKGVRWVCETQFISGKDNLHAIANVHLVFVKKDIDKFRLVRKLPENINKALLDLQKGLI